MPRPNRVEYPGAFYHVYNRGNRKGKIFIEERDYKLFVGLLFALTRRCDIQLYAWCLMPNHFHLLLETPKGNLSQFMQRLLTAYSQVINFRYNFVGHVFQGRYKAKICQKDVYFLELIRYIHLNPIRVKSRNLVSKLEHWPWSSHSQYITNRGPSHIKTTIERVLLNFDSNIQKAKNVYKQFLTEKPYLKIQEEFRNLEKNGVLGNKEFIERLRNNIGKTERIEYGRQVEHKLDLPGWAELAAQRLQISEGIFHSQDKKRTSSRIRKAFAHFARMDLHVPMKELADFMCRDPSAIRRMVSQLEVEEDQWPEVRKLRNLLDSAKYP